MLPFSDLKGVYGVAVEGAGNVYVIDNRGGGRVLELRVGSSNATELPFGNTHGYALPHPAGVAVDASGNVFVADSWNDRVIELGQAPAP